VIVAAVASSGAAGGTAVVGPADEMSMSRVAGVIAALSSAAMRRWPPSSRSAMGHIRY
jgi:hypothetical protein